MRPIDDRTPVGPPGRHTYATLAGIALLGDEVAAQVIREIDERGKNTVVDANPDPEAENKPAK